MGDKRPSIRTLPSGERCHHHPADDQHPEGKLVLIKDCSALRDKLNDMYGEHKERHAELKAAHTERIEIKRAHQRRKGLPAEKSPI